MKNWKYWVFLDPRNKTRHCCCVAPWAAVEVEIAWTFKTPSLLRVCNIDINRAGIVTSRIQELKWDSYGVRRSRHWPRTCSLFLLCWEKIQHNLWKLIDRISNKRGSKYLNMSNRVAPASHKKLRFLRALMDSKVKEPPVIMLLYTSFGSGKK